MEKVFVIEGVIKSNASHKGIPDLVVVAIDIDFKSIQDQSYFASFEQRLMYDRLGSVLTNNDGKFNLSFRDDDFIQRDPDLKPDIMLIVLAPEISIQEPFSAELIDPLSLGENIIHVSPPIRLKAGKIESYSIRINQETIEKFQLEKLTQPSLPDLDDLAKQMANNRFFSQGLIDLKIQETNLYIQGNESLLHSADDLFSDFSLSSTSPQIRAKDTFWMPSKELTELQSNIIERRLTEWETEAYNKSFNVILPSNVAQQVGIINENGEISPNILSSRLTDWWKKKNDTIVERREEKYGKCTPLFTEEDLDEPSPIPETEGPDSSIDNLEDSDSDIEAKVSNLIECATCPEAPLLYSKIVDPKYKDLELKDTINGLELRSGPTDVDTYYDFDSIQIAFESIWTELFDESIEKLGKDIYSEIVKTTGESQFDNLIPLTGLSFQNPSSLRSLLDHYKSSKEYSGLRSVLTQYNRVTGSSVNSRLDYLFSSLEQHISEPYKFDVFAPNSYNFGLMFTFRQKWEPQSYQVGRLVKTIPLAPKEVRRYKTKVVQKRTVNQKELEDREFKGSSESSGTSRAESEIIARATNKTSFSTNSRGKLDMQMYDMEFGMNTGMESEKFSSTTKKNFREAVLKATQEYRKQTKLEVESSSEETYVRTESGEISNPNEEISVTYLFYELQRQFFISEQLHRLTPIICVAFEVPKPHEIDNDWLMKYSWIIRRVLLDESFHSGLDYLTNSAVGDEIALEEMGKTLTRQQAMVDELTSQLEIKNRHVDNIMKKLVVLMEGDAAIQTVKETGDFIHSLINPIAGLFGGDDDSGPGLENFKEVVELQLERSEKEQKRLESRLREAQSDLQSITDKFGEMSRNYFDQQTAIAQLRIHVKENILYYMQAIWDYEPRDQRYFRLYDLEIEWFEDPDTPIATTGLVPRVNPITGAVEFVEGEVFLPMGGIRRTPRKLVDVADLDNLLGFKGNYAIFPVKEPNYVHLFMMKDFIDTQTGGTKDPDQFADTTTQELIDYLKCVRTHNPDVYEEEKDDIIERINERLQRPRREKELVVVPTDSLYIECLPGKHAVLEDFKLVHRAIDVKMAQAEVRKMELENLRFASRLLENNLSDPEVDKKIQIEGSGNGLGLNV